MGLDSVEIVMNLEESFGISIADQDAAELRTPRMIVDFFTNKLGGIDGPTRSCFTLRAFHRLRTSIISAAGVKRDQVRLDVCLKDLTGPDWRRTMEKVRSISGIDLPKPSSFKWFERHTVADFTRWIVVHAAKELRRSGEAWTRSDIRSVVRAVITNQLDLEDFGDDDDFVYDLGIDR